MPKTKISEFSATPANNTDIDSINIAEGCAPSGINDAIRELMAQLKDFQTGAQGDSFNGPIGSTTPAAGAFTTLSASGTATLSGLTASTALALDASKNVVSVTNTGTGNNVLATSPTLVTPALGTPSALVGTNITGTAANFNINGTVGATTANTGAFTTLTTSSTVTHNGGTANGVTYLNGSKVLTSGSALTFNGTETLALTASGGAAFNVGGSTGKIFLYADNSGTTLGALTDIPLRFFVNGSETFRTTSTSLYTASGINVGIGLSSPNGLLNVKGSNGQVILANGNTSGGMKITATNSTFTADGYLAFEGYTKEYGRFDTSGTLLVGCTGGGASGIGMVSYGDGGDIQKIFSTQASSAFYTLISMYSGSTTPSAPTGTLRVNITTNGGIANFQANDSNLSDRREKTNFAPATSYLDKICAIPVQTFNYIDQNLEEDGGLTLGVVAQDVQAVAPELVNESNWGTDEAPKVRLSIYQTDLQYALMKCIQEQQAIIESLKARLDAANL